MSKVQYDVTKVINEARDKLSQVDLIEGNEIVIPLISDFKVSEFQQSIDVYFKREDNNSGWYVDKIQSTIFLK